MYSGEDLNLGWHTAGFVWAPDRISFFWDGRLIYTRMYQWLRKDGQLGPPAHVDLNFAVGGAWAGRHGIDEAAFPQSFKIDYVRVCQFTDSDEGTRQCGPSQVTPDPKGFGYSSTIRDLAKPAFLPVKAASGQQPNAGVLSLKATDPLKIEVPISVPEDYPSNRQLQVWVYDPAARATVATVERKLQESAGNKRADGASVVELSLPALQRAGNLVLDAKLVSATTDDKGAKQVLASPIACRTDVAQPIKARSCRLLTLEVH
jgi:Glycosyl hydrolases family 16